MQEKINAILEELMKKFEEVKTLQELNDLRDEIGWDVDDEVVWEEYVSRQQHRIEIFYVFFYNECVIKERSDQL